MKQEQRNIDYRSLLEDGLFQLKKTQSRLKALEYAKTEPIAIVGMGCRFPGGIDNPAQLWRILRDGVDTITEVPKNRWDIDAYYDRDPEAIGKMYTRNGGFVNDVDTFDAHFFNISPREAMSLDPQQRLLLEVSWQALENSYQDPLHLYESSTGVFLGICSNDYSRKLSSTGEIDAYFGTGNAISAAAGRLSYFLGLTGPSLAVDTACSSSLVAVHLACQSLRKQECSLALAGGVNLLLSPENSIVFSQARMLSPDGRCKTFDAAADGYVRGEGCGVIVLKRLSDAIKSQDNILAVIRGSAINQDGPSGGLTVPNGPSQQKVIRQALKNGGVDPSLVSYIEAHGTGTSLGDPIEVKALGAVFSKSHSPEYPLMIGSLKTNMGHLEAAAGIAGLIKVVLQLQYQEIVPHLHLKEPNPHINWDELPVSVPTQLTPWSVDSQKRIGGVSSFGFSGTNAHVVLEEAPTQESQVKDSDLGERPWHILTLSAKCEKALQELVQRHEELLSNNSTAAIADVCFSANTGRAHFNHRLAIITSDKQDLADKLAKISAGEEANSVFSRKLPGNSRSPKIAFLFTGQGSQYVNMGRQLYETQPVFRQTLDQCERILQSYLEKSLLNVIYPENTKELNNSVIDQTAYTQPTLFALEYALFQLWQSWGIKPDVVMGHSVGEYVAACVAGVVSLEDGLKLIAHRGRLMQQLPSGGEMVAVMASFEKVNQLIAPYTEKVAIAAINGPESIVISGEAEAIRTVKESLEAEGIKTKQLQVSHAFHSPLMEPMLADFEAVANQITYNRPRIPLISNVTGIRADESIATAKYWVNHVRQPVKFAQSLDTLHQEGYDIFLEIGPKPILLGMGRQCLPEDVGIWLPSLRPGQADWSQMLQSLAELYVRGVKVDWLGFDRDYGRRRVVLPTYPFQRQRYWVETADNGHSPAESPAQLPTPIVNLLHRGDTQQLAQNLETAAKLSPEEAKFLPKLLEILVKQHQQQQKAASLPDWLYEVSWQPQTRQNTEMSFTEAGSWLILTDQNGVGQALAQLLEERGQNCCLVYVGDTYQAKEPLTWSLNPAHPNEFEQLLQEIKATEQPPLKGVIHLWSLEATFASQLSLNSLEQIQVLGCGSTLHLVQALAKHYEQALPRLWLVTRGAVPVDSSLPGVAQASLWGLGKVIALEQPQLWGGLIDLAADAPRDEPLQLLAEIRDSQGEDQLAFRCGQRHVARLVRGKMPVAGSLSLQAHSTYLITGGLGALGLKIAQWLVEQGVRHLVLTSRREASEKARAALARMEELGAQVVVARADVAEWGEMVKLFEEIKTSMPPLRGIIHAAGVLDDGILRQQNWERFAQVMAPKIKGTWNLHLLTQELSLDFWVSFSSVASLLGSPGQGNYAAANAFMDAVAHYRTAAGLPGLSLNWGPWDEAGMAASLDVRQRTRLSAQGIEPIPLAAGLQILENLLAGSAAQVGILPVNWTKFMQRFPEGVMSSFLDSVGIAFEQPAKQQTQFLQELQSAPVSERRNLLIGYVRSQVAQVLGLGEPERIDIQQGLSDLGLDSLMSVELKNHLQTSLGCSIPTTLAYDYPTVEALTDYLAKEVMGAEFFDESTSELHDSSDRAERSTGGDREQNVTESNLDHLSDREAEELLLSKLDNMRY
jgi:malonyl CoA-acyl carrier protein transacylase